MTHSTRLRALATTAVLVAGLGTLAACGDAGGTTAPSKVATVPSTSVSTISPSSTVSPAGQRLPDGFPKDSVPLLDERVVGGSKGDPGGSVAWSVAMTSSRSIDDLSAEVEKDYAAAGYAPRQSTVMGDVSIHRFTNGTYDVGVTIARTGDGITITYLVKNQR